jgi:uncharacterized membrane protein YgaE (UPF0421/DUF939 family)
MQDSAFRENIEIAVVIIATVIAFILIFIFAPKKGEVIVIDCTWSEISPDFTNEMRQACRQARAENYQKSLQKPK